LLFAFRSTRTCLELRTGRRFWGPRGKILGAQTTSEQNAAKPGTPRQGARFQSGWIRRDLTSCFLASLGFLFALCANVNERTAHEHSAHCTTGEEGTQTSRSSAIRPPENKKENGIYPAELHAQTEPPKPGLAAGSCATYQWRLLKRDRVPDTRKRQGAGVASTQSES
jgi:hypothetical protein